MSENYRFAVYPGHGLSEVYLEPTLTSKVEFPSFRIPIPKGVWSVRLTLHPYVQASAGDAKDASLTFGLSKEDDLSSLPDAEAQGYAQSNVFVPKHATESRIFLAPVSLCAVLSFSEDGFVTAWYKSGDTLGTNYLAIYSALIEARRVT